MRKYYRAILSELSDVVGSTKEEIHEEMKVGYNIASTSPLSFDGWYEYLTFAIELIVHCHEILFDSEGYKQDGVSYIFLFEKIGGHTTKHEELGKTSKIIDDIVTEFGKK